MKKSISILTTAMVLTSSLIANEPVDMNKIMPLKKETWNLFGFNEEVDLKGSFNGTSVQIVWAWNNADSSWVAYSPQYAMEKALKDANNVIVEKLQPNQGFWVRSYEDLEINLKSVFYPLYDMCVNVNSSYHWENNSSVTEAFPQCKAYLENYPKLEVTNTILDGNATSVKGSFETNFPAVFYKDLSDTTNPMVSIGNLNSDLTKYIEANGTISNVVITKKPAENENGEITNFSFNLNTTPDFDNFATNMKIFIGNENNSTKAIEVSIPFPPFSQN